jgi:hypothetical protein
MSEIPGHVLVHALRKLVEGAFKFIEWTGKTGGVLGVAGLLLGFAVGRPLQEVPEDTYSNAFDSSMSFALAITECAALAIGGALLGVALALLYRKVSSG